MAGEKNLEAVKNATLNSTKEAYKSSADSMIAGLDERYKEMMQNDRDALLRLTDLNELITAFGVFQTKVNAFRATNEAVAADANAPEDGEGEGSKDAKAPEAKNPEVQPEPAAAPPEFTDEEAETYKKEYNSSKNKLAEAREKGWVNQFIRVGQTQGLKVAPEATPTDKVKAIQSWLIENEYNLGSWGADGKLGPMTFAAMTKASEAVSQGKPIGAKAKEFNDKYNAERKVDRNVEEVATDANEGKDAANEAPEVDFDHEVNQTESNLKRSIWTLQNADQDEKIPEIEATISDGTITVAGRAYRFDLSVDQDEELMGGTLTNEDGVRIASLTPVATYLELKENLSNVLLAAHKMAEDAAAESAETDDEEDEATDPVESDGGFEGFARKIHGLDLIIVGNELKLGGEDFATLVKGKDGDDFYYELKYTDGDSDYTGEYSNYDKDLFNEIAALAKAKYERKEAGKVEEIRRELDDSGVAFLSRSVGHYTLDDIRPGKGDEIVTGDIEDARISFTGVATAALGGGFRNNPDVGKFTVKRNPKGAGYVVRVSLDGLGYLQKNIDTLDPDTVGKTVAELGERIEGDPEKIRENLQAARNALTGKRLGGVEIAGEKTDINLFNLVVVFASIPEAARRDLVHRLRNKGVSLTDADVSFESIDFSDFSREDLQEIALAAGTMGLFGGASKLTNTGTISGKSLRFDVDGYPLVIKHRVGNKYEVNYRGQKADLAESALSKPAKLARTVQRVIRKASRE